MRCPFRFPKTSRGSLRCMSGAARILASTVYTTSIYIASRRAHRTERNRGVIGRPLSLGDSPL